MREGKKWGQIWEGREWCNLQTDSKYYVRIVALAVK